MRAGRQRGRAAGAAERVGVVERAVLAAGSERGCVAAAVAAAAAAAGFPAVKAAEAGVGSVLHGRAVRAYARERGGRCRYWCRGRG